MTHMVTIHGHHYHPLKLASILVLWPPDHLLATGHTRPLGHHRPPRVTSGHLGPPTWTSGHLHWPPATSVPQLRMPRQSDKTRKYELILMKYYILAIRKLPTINTKLTSVAKHMLCCETSLSQWTRDPTSQNTLGQMATILVKLCDKRVHPPGMSLPRAGLWTYCLFTPS